MVHEVVAWVSDVFNIWVNPLLAISAYANYQRGAHGVHVRFQIAMLH